MFRSLYDVAHGWTLHQLDPILADIADRFHEVPGVTGLPMNETALHAGWRESRAI
jgi:hypothetical protein